MDATIDASSARCCCARARRSASSRCPAIDVNPLEMFSPKLRKKLPMWFAGLRFGFGELAISSRSNAALIAPLLAPLPRRPLAVAPPPPSAWRNFRKCARSTAAIESSSSLQSGQCDVVMRSTSHRCVRLKPAGMSELAPARRRFRRPTNEAASAPSCAAPPELQASAKINK